MSKYLKGLWKPNQAKKENAPTEDAEVKNASQPTKSIGPLDRVN